MSILPWDQLDKACLQAFGRDVLYLPEAGGQAVVRAIFQPTREAEDQSPGVNAVLFARSSDLPSAPACGDEIDVDGVRYKLYDIEADVAGGLVLRLRRTA